MAGVCFGHQLMAQALGGIVRKSEKGWGIGRHVYEIAPGNGVIRGKHIAIAASHQDQVVEPPPGARTILSSAFTEHAGLLYGNGSALSVQPHPEFDIGFAHICCDIRKGEAPDAVVAQAKASLAEPVDNAALGGAVTRFLTRAHAS
jgi:GMP synthase-like glutamine amidotransferase